ncbi:MAG: hypothetical protein JWM80_1056 [Cyanobacteria bacterium RYN_339]|nr:hypothetical protein [Cyanobacteria bacterium RYN_339]
MPSFDDLRQAKAHGFTLTTLMVQAYLREHGPTPVGLIARACELSIRSVERSIAVLKEKVGLPSRETTKMSHDHADHGSNQEGTASTVAVNPVVAKLLAFEVLPWCADMLAAKVDPAVLERQLAFHEHRLKSGFPFKGHPARYLFRACLNDYQPPADFYAQPQRPTSAPRREAVAPVATPQTEMTRDGAITTIRMGMRSKLPHMRAEAQRLAERWQIDLKTFAC